MNAIILTTLSIFLPAQVHASGLELKLVLDRTVIARGDLAYCEVQLWNRSSSAIEIPRMSPVAPLRITVELSDGKFIETQLDGGGVQGAPMQSVMPGESVSAPAQIVLWNYDVLKNAKNQQREIIGTATLSGYRRKYVTPVSFSFRCRGRVASEEFLLATLYQTGEERKKAQRRTKSLSQFMESVDSVRVGVLVQDSLITGKAIDKLIKDLRPGTSIRRKAMIARLIIEYGTRPNMPFEEFERRLMRLTAKCGPAEQRWLLLQCATGLGHRGQPQDGTRVRKLSRERPDTHTSLHHSKKINCQYAKVAQERVR